MFSIVFSDFVACPQVLLLIIVSLCLFTDSFFSSIKLIFVALQTPYLQMFDPKHSAGLQLN